MHRLVLIDGNAILHRAYHALPPLTAPDGSVVNAVYGFASILLRLFFDLEPSHMAVAFDRAVPTFRKELFKDYQVHRPKMEDALVSQVEKVHDLVKGFGLPIYELDGFEADDIIATIVSQVQDVKRNMQSDAIDEVIVVTGDRDLLQLVDDSKGIKAFMPVKGLSEGKLYSEKDVVERMGVTPQQIVTFKALAGDASDNYPGVAGVGPKTTVELVTTFDTIENLYNALSRHDERLNKFSQSVQEKLRNGKQSAILSEKLATVRRDVPLAISIEDARISSLDTENVHKALETYGFKSLVKRLNLTKKETGSTQEKIKKQIQEDEQLSLV